MRSKFNKVQEMIDSLTLEEQKQILEIAGKRLIEKKRARLLNRVEDAERILPKADLLKVMLKIL
jgi:hypothetical protein